ncbi:MAG: hypothetical protein RSD95_02755 [Clostridia bacterium]
MTIKELSNLYFLDKLIERDMARLQEMEDRMQPGAQIITGMPHRPGTSDTIGDTVPLAMDLRSKIAGELAQFRAEKAKLESYIDSVPDMSVRLILTLRFVDLKKWNEIADLVGSDATESSVKQLLYRFVRGKNRVPNVTNVTNVTHVTNQSDIV